MLENCIVDASIFDFFQDCDRGTYGHGFPWVFLGMRVVVVVMVCFLVSVIVGFC